MGSTDFYLDTRNMDAIITQVQKIAEIMETTKENYRKTITSLTVNWDGKSRNIFIYRLLTHNALKEYDKAFELADYLGRVSPDEASVHAFRSLIYKDMGEQENAAAELEMAKRLNPNIKG